MATEIDFDGGREPAEIVAVALFHEKCRLGEVHFAGDVEHPRWFGWFWEEADRGWVPSERAIRESVNLRYPKAHALIYCSRASLDATQFTQAPANALAYAARTVTPAPAWLGAAKA